MATEEVLQQILAALRCFLPSQIQNILWDHFKTFLTEKGRHLNEDQAPSAPCLDSVACWKGPSGSSRGDKNLLLAVSLITWCCA